MVHIFIKVNIALVEHYRHLFISE